MDVTDFMITDNRYRKWVTELKHPYCCGRGEWA